MHCGWRLDLLRRSSRRIGVRMIEGTMRLVSGATFVVRTKNMSRRASLPPSIASLALKVA